MQRGQVGAWICRDQARLVGVYGEKGMRIPMPMFLLRRIVRENPWLLSESGNVRRNIKIPLGLFAIEVTARVQLLPKQKARLLTEWGRGRK